MTRFVLVLGLALLAACTTGTDVDDSAPAAVASGEQARLDRIAQLAHRLVDDARAQPQKPASALVADLEKLMNEAETP